jgi:O-acetyl-ADP-ribose deacetylase (regulator of RNase III)
VEIRLVQGDITTREVDAIVNAANSGLLGGGGVDGAIHRAGGPEILAECRRIRDTEWPRGLPTGEAVATTAGRLPARWVIHTVGPVWTPKEDRSSLLRNAYRHSLELADRLGATSIAFPLISSGIYGWPKEDALGQALSVLLDAETGLHHAELVLYDGSTRRLANEVLQRMRRDAEDPDGGTIQP